MSEAKFNEQELFEQFEQELENEQRTKESALKDAEITRRLSAYIAKQESDAAKEARRIAQMRERAMDRVLVLGISANNVKRLYQGKYPLIYITLPARVIKLLEEAFACEGNSAELSRYCSCLVSTLSGALSSEARKKALEQLSAISGKRWA